MESSRRGRGRPRKVWTIPPLDACNAPSAASSPNTLNTETQTNEINLDDTELLLHFIQLTAQTVAGDAPPKDSMTHFWTKNVPRIGLAYPFVLHLMYALAAYHIAFLSFNEERKRHFKCLASKHVARGTAELARTTGTLDDNNCGAAYLGATLVCYCTFAAGPGSPEDLMICYLGDEQNARWINLVSGLRLIRGAFMPSVLFAGLMSPLGPLPGTPEKEVPRISLCTKLGQVPLQWQPALVGLRRFVARRQGMHVRVCLCSLDELVKLFEGVYGDESGHCKVSGDYQFVLGWLYRLDGEFIQALRSADTSALVILAHYAVLLKIMDGEWWLKGWAEHLCISIRDIPGDDVAPLMDWPMGRVFGSPLRQRTRK